MTRVDVAAFLRSCPEVIDPDAHAAEAVAVERDAAGNVVAVAAVRRDTLMGRPVAMFRCVVHPSHRRRGLARALFARAWDSPEVRALGVDGVAAVIYSSELLASLRAEATWPTSRLSYVGTDERGRQVRVRWFDESERANLMSSITRRLRRSQQRERKPTMQRIQIPEPLMIQEKTDTQPEVKLDVLWFARHFLNARIFTSSGAMLRSATRIEDAIMAAVDAGADHFDLYDEDAEIICKLVDEPEELGYPTPFSRKDTHEPVPLTPRILRRFVDPYKHATPFAEPTAEAAQ